jgi:hypothetical protein
MKRQYVFLATGLSLLGGGSVGAAIVFGHMPQSQSAGSVPSSEWVTNLSGLLFVVLQWFGQAILAFWAAIPLRDPRLPTGKQTTKTRIDLFNRHLVLIGSFLYFTSVAAVIAVSLAIWNGGIVEPFRSAASQPILDVPPKHIAAIFAMACAFALIGALFFIAYRLMNIRDAEIDREDFQLGEFWGGLFVRCGEAVLLTFAIFLILMGLQSPPNQAPATSQPSAGSKYFGLPLLPAIGLLGGMLIKSFEQLVFGLADRLFEAAAVVFPSTDNSADSSGKPGDGKSPSTPKITTSAASKSSYSPEEQLQMEEHDAKVKAAE